MCLYPKLLRNKKYTANKKNNYNAPELKDERIKYVPVGCQECIECRKQYKNQWLTRLLEDIKRHRNGKFVTPTLSNESIKHLAFYIKADGYTFDNQLATLAVRRFLERYRKEHGKSLRHWLVTELGHNGTENIHLHGIIWTDEPLSKIEKIWGYGYMWKGKGDKQVNYVSARTVNYITKYITKTDLEHRTYKSIILTSPGIGANYLNNIDSKKNRYNGKETNTTYRTGNGNKISLPIYWRNKIYTENEREQLWLQMLDKQERYICGERIDISKTDQGYWRTLEHYRKINHELGYGTDEKDWHREQYEREQRNLKNAERIRKAKN